MPITILIGPSNVGKTTIAKKLAAKKSNFIHLDMDKEASVNNPGFMKRAKKIIEDCRQKTSVYLLDFGAGFQNNAEFYDLCYPYRESMVTIMDDPERIFKRHPHRNWEEFRNTEFREYREKIYRLSKYNIVNKDLKRSVDELYKIICKIVGQQKN